jgi:hypothetical protein
MTDAHFSSTRRALHGVAELLLAGPQHAASGSIKLRAVSGGFGTSFGAEVAVIGADIVTGGTRTALHGRTIRELAIELGLTFADLAHVYRDVSGIDPDQLLEIDAAAAVRICDAYGLGDAALREFAPDQEPVLWPEHFDIAITAHEINFGIAPGDDGIETPYMYVGPWSVPAADDFWNASFGAQRPLAQTTAEVVAFFAEGRDRATRRVTMGG